jgi:outer membrane protein TolC
MMLASLVMLNGCTTTLYQNWDMAEQRRTNLAEDLSLLHPQSPVDVPDPLTVDTAIRIGLQNNLDMRISKVVAEITDENTVAEKLKRLPALNFNATLSQSSHSSDPDVDKLQKSGSLSLTWNILDFGLSYIRSWQAAMQSEIRRMERLRQAQTLARDISTAYWKAVLAEQSLEQIRTLETEVKDYKTKAEILVSQKRLDPIASKAIEKKIVELAITAANLRAEISNGKIELCRLMGLSPGTLLNLAREDFRTFIEKMPMPETLEPQKLEMISLNNRPEFFSSDFEVRVQQEEARAVLVSMFPGIQFSSSNYYNANSNYENNIWTVWGATISSSLLSLPSKYAEWQGQKKSIEMVKLQRVMLTAGVIVQAHMSLHDYTVKRRQFNLYDDSFAIAEDLLRMSRERHELGLLSNWALTQRMLEEVVARLERDRRIVEVINAYNTLLVTMGLNYDRWTESISEIDENALPEDIETIDIPLITEGKMPSEIEPDKEESPVPAEQEDEFDVSPEEDETINVPLDENAGDIIEDSDEYIMPDTTDTDEIGLPYDEVFGIYEAC